MARARRDPLAPDGDLPDPDTLQRYKDISQNCLDRILEVFCAEAAHQRTLEGDALQARITFARRGQIFGLVIGMTAILAGATTAMTGHDFAGGVIGAGGVVGLVSVFVLGRNQEPEAEPTEALEPAEPTATA